MSRSHRHTPIVGFTKADSEKTDKKIWHHRLRARTRSALVAMNEIFPSPKEVSEPYTFAKDGKQWVPGINMSIVNRYHRRGVKDIRK